MTNAEAVNWLINITADIGKVEHQDLWHYEQALSEIREILEDAPQRMRGRWIDQKDGGCCCSECGGYALDEPDGNFIHVAVKSNFCPNCGSYNGGADMRGGQDEG